MGATHSLHRSVQDGISAVRTWEDPNGRAFSVSADVLSGGRASVHGIPALVSVRDVCKLSAACAAVFKPQTQSVLLAPHAELNCARAKQAAQLPLCAQAALSKDALRVVTRFAQLQVLHDPLFTLTARMACGSTTLTLANLNAVSAAAVALAAQDPAVLADRSVVNTRKGHVRFQLSVPACAPARAPPLMQERAAKRTREDANRASGQTGGEVPPAKALKLI